MEMSTENVTILLTESSRLVVDKSSDYVKFIITADKAKIATYFTAFNTLNNGAAVRYSSQSVLGLLITESESAEQYCGSVLPLKLLELMCRNTVTLDSLRVFFHVCHCVYTELGIFETNTNTDETHQLGHKSCNLPSHSLWAILILAEVFGATRVTQLSTQQLLRKVVLSRAPVDNNNNNNGNISESDTLTKVSSIFELLFKNITPSLSNEQVLDIRDRLEVHFLQFGPSLQPIITAPPPADTIPSSHNILQHSSNTILQTPQTPIGAVRTATTTPFSVNMTDSSSSGTTMRTSTTNATTTSNTAASVITPRVRKSFDRSAMFEDDDNEHLTPNSSNVSGDMTRDDGSDQDGPLHKVVENNTTHSTPRLDHPHYRRQEQDRQRHYHEQALSSLQHQQQHQHYQQPQQQHRTVSPSTTVSSSSLHSHTHHLSSSSSQQSLSHQENERHEHGRLNSSAREQLSSLSSYYNDDNAQSTYHDKRIHTAYPSPYNQSNNDRQSHSVNSRPRSATPTSTRGFKDSNSKTSIQQQQQQQYNTPRRSNTPTRLRQSATTPSIERPRAPVSDEQLQLSRSIALDRLKSVRVQEDLQQAKDRADRELRANALKALELKAAIARYEATAPKMAPSNGHYPSSSSSGSRSGTPRSSPASNAVAPRYDSTLGSSGNSFNVKSLGGISVAINTKPSFPSGGNPQTQSAVYSSPAPVISNAAAVPLKSILRGTSHHTSSSGNTQSPAQQSHRSSAPTSESSATRRSSSAPIQRPGSQQQQRPLTATGPHSTDKSITVESHRGISSLGASLLSARRQQSHTDSYQQLSSSSNSGVKSAADVTKEARLRASQRIKERRLEDQLKEQQAKAAKDKKKQDVFAKRDEKIAKFKERQNYPAETDFLTSAVPSQVGYSSPVRTEDNTPHHHTRGLSSTTPAAAVGMNKHTGNSPLTPEALAAVGLTLNDLLPPPPPPPVYKQTTALAAADNKHHISAPKLSPASAKIVRNPSPSLALNTSHTTTSSGTGHKPHYRYDNSFLEDDSSSVDYYSSPVPVPIPSSSVPLKARTHDVSPISSTAAAVNVSNTSSLTVSVASDMFTVRILRAYDLRECLPATNAYVTVDWGKEYGVSSTQTVRNTTMPEYNSTLKFKSPFTSSVFLDDLHKGMRNPLPIMRIIVRNKNPSISDETLGYAEVNMEDVIRKNNTASYSGDNDGIMVHTVNLIDPSEEERGDGGNHKSAVSRQRLYAGCAEYTVEY